MTTVKDMALTPDEFFRGVALAMEEQDYRVENNGVEAGSPDRGISISIQPLPPRRLSGLLSLPRAQVTISFRGYGAAEEAEFLQRFDRVFQRGGG
jgi:hypothetical protein